MDCPKELDSAVPVTPKLSTLAELELMVRARITMQTEHTVLCACGGPPSPRF
jgi:hypothetical protein